MPTLVTTGDRLLSVSGRETWLKRSSQPFSAWQGGSGVSLVGGATTSYARLFRTQPWVAIAVNKLARQIARLPLKTYVRDGEDRKRVRDHPVAELLERPWERGSPSDLKQALAFPTLLHGNGLLGKSRPRAGLPPTSVVPLDWRFMVPHFDEGHPVMFWESTLGGSSYLAPADVVHTTWWAPDGPVGVSPLEQLGVTIRLEDAAQRYSTSSFTNASRHSGALITPPDVRLDREERKELRDEIQAIHGGVDNAFKMLLLTGGLDFKAFSQTAKEAELIEARKLNREEVAAVYDIPPPLIGILDHATYSNVAEMHRMLYMTVLGPWLNLIEETLQSQLIDAEPAWRDDGVFVEFDLAEVLKGDTAERVSALQVGIGTGLYTINEARKVENLPRIDHPDADQPLIPQNNLAPLGSEPAVDSPPIAPVLASHLARARDRVLSKAGAGVEPLFDPERFRLELEADLPSLNGEAKRLAGAWAERLAEAIDRVGSDSAGLKRLFGEVAEEPSVERIVKAIEQIPVPTIHVQAPASPPAEVYVDVRGAKVTKKKIIRDDDGQITAIEEQE